jgi:hypothetical protein
MLVTGSSWTSQIDRFLEQQRHDLDVRFFAAGIYWWRECLSR